MTGNPETELLGLPSRLLADDVLHVRARSDAGIIGMSVLSRAASVVAEARTLNTLALANWQNGMRPSGYFSAPNFLTPPNRILANEAAARYSGPSATGRTPIMEGGFKFEALSFSSVDAEMLASRRLSTTEIAALFNIPAALLGGDGAGTGSDLLLASFAQLALTPIVTALEAEFDRAVLIAGQHLALDMGGLLRGNYAAVAASQAVLVQSGICRPNDARRILSLPAVPEGDVLRVGAPPSYPADVKGGKHSGPSPGPGGVLPNIGTNQGEGSS